MAPRVLKRGPDYTLDVKTRVPTGSIERTRQPNLTPAKDYRAEGFTFLSRLARLGYSLTGFFNQNNENNAVKGWDDMVPEVQSYFNSVPTTDPAKLEEIYKQGISKYSDHIQTLDYNNKVKDKIIVSLNDYAERKMEQAWSKSLSENEIGNITNLNTQIDILVKEEDINGAHRLITKASGILSDGIGGFGKDETIEDTWLNEKAAQAMWIKADNIGIYEILKNDALEMDTLEAHNYLNAKDPETGEYINGIKVNNDGNITSSVSPQDRLAIKGIVNTRDNFEKKLADQAYVDSINDFGNALINQEIDEEAFLNGEGDSSELEFGDRLNLYNNVNNVFKIKEREASEAEYERLLGKWNLGTLARNEILTSQKDQSLTTPRATQLLSLFDNVTVEDIVKKAEMESKLLAEGVMINVERGNTEPLTALRFLSEKTTEGNEVGLPVLYWDDYTEAKDYLQSETGLDDTSSVYKSIERDPRMEGDVFKINEFKRLFRELVISQIQEKDPSKQMTTAQMNSEADAIAAAVVDEDLQKKFSKVKSGGHLGFGFGGIKNRLEASIEDLNNGFYDGIRWTDPSGWSDYMNNIQDEWNKQYLKDTGEPYTDTVRMHGNIPVFRKDGVDVMLDLDGNKTVIITLEQGLKDHQNLALGHAIGEYDVGLDRYMAKTGWYKTEDLEILGMSGDYPLYRPTVNKKPVEGEFIYAMYADFYGNSKIMVIHSDPRDDVAVAAEIREVQNLGNQTIQSPETQLELQTREELKLRYPGIFQ